MEMNNKNNEMIVYNTFIYNKERIAGQKIINGEFIIYKQLATGSYWNVYLVKRKSSNDLNNLVDEQTSLYVFKEGIMDQISSEFFDLNLAKSDSMSFGCNKDLLNRLNQDKENLEKNLSLFDSIQPVLEDDEIVSRLTNEETETRTGMREYHILKKLNHLNIARLYECIMDIEKNKVVLVMEYADLGTLMRPSNNMNYYDYNVELINYILKECVKTSDVLVDYEDCVNFLKHHKVLVRSGRYLFKMLAEAIKYLHDKLIAHRDIKPENILLKSKDKQLKLVDFSIARVMKSYEESIVSDSGTCPFKCKESYQEAYNPFKADVYSFGASLFVYLFNRFSYDLNDDVEDVLLLKQVYPQVYQLLNLILYKNLDDCPTIDEVLEHDYFKL